MSVYSAKLPSLRDKLAAQERDVKAELEAELKAVKGAKKRAGKK